MDKVFSPTSSSCSLLNIGNLTFLDKKNSKIIDSVPFNISLWKAFDKVLFPNVYLSHMYTCQGDLKSPMQTNIVLSEVWFIDI
ncbi:hypothetical protein PVL29_019510 [Vitis rotundifolia]|uniref:Uncharacterized protein n=1 Tax=Vitis rotundifolia TaxID=103349 RepID=A0AA38Z0W8_VITRO|nr:hypothetical protein PVL29_019510 [Vitis rotundifolia]